MKGDSRRVDGLVTLRRAGPVHLVFPGRPGRLLTRCGLERTPDQVRAARRPVTCRVCARWDRQSVVAPAVRHGPEPDLTTLFADARAARVGGGQAVHMARVGRDGRVRTRCGRDVDAQAATLLPGAALSCRLCRRWARLRAVGSSRWATTQPD